MRSAWLAVVAVVLAVSLQAAPQIDSSEIQLQAAVNKATVEGDLKGAIFDFQKILNTPGVSRPVAAKALLHLGQCHEKLGTAEARKSYERILKDYADQGDVVRQARERLATLAKTAVPAPEDALQGRRVVGPFNHLRVAVSPDGRYVTYLLQPAGTERSGGPRRPDRSGPDDRRRRGGDAGLLAGQREIAYVGQPLREAPELRVVKRTGADDRVIFKRADVKGITLFDWMPDGKDLLVRLAREDKSTELALVPVAGGAPRTVRSPSPYAGPAERGHLSSDGKVLRLPRAGGGWRRVGHARVHAG